MEHGLISTKTVQHKVCIPAINRPNQYRLLCQVGLVYFIKKLKTTIPDIKPPQDYRLQQYYTHAHMCMCVERERKSLSTLLRFEDRQTERERQREPATVSLHMLYSSRCHQCHILYPFPPVLAKYLCLKAEIYSNKKST